MIGKKWTRNKPQPLPVVQMLLSNEHHPEWNRLVIFNVRGAIELTVCLP